MNNRFGEDHEAEMASRAFPFCWYCREEMCLSEYFNIDFLQEWRTHSEEDMVLGDGTKPPLNNSSIRKFLYRQFLLHSRWRPLEKNKRVVIPKCVTTLIRNDYPGKDNAYMVHRWKAATTKRTYAVDDSGEEIRNIYWVHEDNAWVLKHQEN